LLQEKGVLQLFFLPNCTLGIVQIVHGRTVPFLLNFSPKSVGKFCK
jgi:hypothetical protein